MNRRTLLASVATVSAATAGCIGPNSREPTQSESDVEDRMDMGSVPEETSNVLPLMESFMKAIRPYYPESSLTVNKKGEIFFEYTSEKQSADELKTEIHQIADVYIDAAEGYEATTLTIVTSNVTAVVPRNTAQKRLDGELEQDAFHETIGLLSRD